MASLAHVAVLADSAIFTLLIQYKQILQTYESLASAIKAFISICPSSETDLQASSQPINRVLSLLVSQRQDLSFQYYIAPCIVGNNTDPFELGSSQLSSITIALETVARTLSQYLEIIDLHRSEITVESPEPSWKSRGLVKELDSRLSRQYTQLDLSVFTAYVAAPENATLQKNISRSLRFNERNLLILLSPQKAS